MILSRLKPKANAWSSGVILFPFSTGNLLNFDDSKFTTMHQKSAAANFGASVVKGWKGTSWSFPRGKKNKDEEDHACAVREVLEETGFDVSKFLNKDDYIEMIFGQQRVRLYIIAGVKDDIAVAPLTKKEISVCCLSPSKTVQIVKKITSVEIAWQRLDEIQPANEDVISRGTTGLKLYMVDNML
ncbi:hypothetical protein CsSME_00028394 [Camellia sinensis var. sinensis]